MAKKNVRDEPLKPQVTENEQMSDIILILDKMELLLQAVSKLDKDGRHETVPADRKYRNSFLKIDRYASMFENSSSSTRLSPATRKTKVSTIKIKKKWQKKMKHSSRPPKVEARSNSPSTATTSP